MKKSIFLLLALVFVLSGCSLLKDKPVPESDPESGLVVSSVEVGSEFPEGWVFFLGEDKEYVLSAPSEFHLSGGADIKTLANYDTEDPLYVSGTADDLNIQIQASGLVGSFENKMISMGNTPVSLGNITYSNYTSDGPGGAFQQYFVEGKNQTYYMILVFEPGYSSFKDLADSIVETFDVL